MELITSLLSLLSQPIPATGFLILLTIFVVWLLGRTKIRSLKAEVKSGANRYATLKTSLETHMEIHQHGQQALKEQVDTLKKELEDARSLIRLLEEKPGRKEWNQLKKCEAALKEMVFGINDRPEQFHVILARAREQLIECPVRSDPPRSRLRLPWTRNS